MEIDLHGFYPSELGCQWGNAGKLADFVKQAWESGESEWLTFIHEYWLPRLVRSQCAAPG